jgi:large subunit ribosomal protein L21
MFAVIKTGGKQYKVAANDVLKIEKLPAEAGEIVTFDQVLMVGNGDDVTVGAPLVDGAMVAAELIETRKQKTVIILKKHRRQHYDRRNGHRQLLSSVRITEILTGGARPSVPARDKAEKPARKGKIEAAHDAAPEVKNAAPEATPEPVAEAAPAKPARKAKAAPGEFVDDVKMIGGVGPAIEKKLAAAGVTSLRQIADWSEADIARFDEELNFHGRIAREEWVEQARDLIAGKPPRAKADQDAAADKAKGKTK